MFEQNGGARFKKHKTNMQHVTTKDSNSMFIYANLYTHIKSKQLMDNPTSKSDECIEQKQEHHRQRCIQNRLNGRNSL